MRFMLMMHAPRGSGDWDATGWSPEDIRAHMDFMHALNRDLAGNGELVSGEGLAPPGQARLVRAGQNGGPPITDGPFPEAKEFLAGFWIVDVDTPERAHEIAAKISAAPGPAGKTLFIPVEVRQVMSAPLPEE
ncbi:MAG TPA: YciI family protein [Gemmatimonadales bacterium]|nr:YciI family protein [Gemmatimonadales bacterium]